MLLWIVMSPVTSGTSQQGALSSVHKPVSKAIFMFRFWSIPVVRSERDTEACGVLPVFVFCLAASDIMQGVGEGVGLPVRSSWPVIIITLGPEPSNIPPTLTARDTPKVLHSHILHPNTLYRPLTPHHPHTHTPTPHTPGPARPGGVPRPTRPGGVLYVLRTS